jgi:hypothetical protein
LDATLVSMQTGDRLRTLERLRDRIAEEIDATDSLHNLERLAARLQSVLGEIAELRPGDGLSPVDEILKRRAERDRKGLPVSVDNSAGHGVGREHR